MNSRMQSGPLLRVLVVLGALLALLIAYYWVHKPFDARFALALGGSGLDLLTGGLLIAAGGGLGRWTLRRLDTGRLSRAERLALEAGIGLGLISLGALLLGLAGLFKGLVLWPALLLLAVLTRRPLVHWLRDGRQLMRSVWPSSGWTRLLAAFVLGLLAIALLLALMPPTAWDALTYHLVAPNRYLHAGQIIAAPDNHFLGFPELVETLYGVLLSLTGRDTSAAVLHAGFGLLALLAVGGLVRRQVSVRAGWLALALLLSSFSLWLLFSAPYVDLAVLAYSALVLVTLSQWRAARLDRWLIVTGGLLGCAVGVKYTVGVLAVAALFTVGRLEPRRIVRNGLLLGGSALVVFLPWALKGGLLYHNPVYPFFFNGLSWDAVRSQTFGLTGGLLGTPDAWQLPILPLAATVLGVERGAGFSFTTGPWLLTLPLLLIPARHWLPERSRTLIHTCLLLMLPLVLLWIGLAAISGLSIQTRFMVVLFPMAAVTGSLAVEGLAAGPRRPIDLAFLLRAMLVLTFLLGAIEPLQELARTRTLETAVGRLSRDDFLRANLGAYSAAMRAVAELPAGSQVRLMWEPRSYYCLRAGAAQGIDCIPDILFDHWALPLVQGAAPQAVLERWRSAGDTHLLVFDLGLDFVLDNGGTFQAYDATFRDALAAVAVPVWTDGQAYTLYAWAPE